MRLHKMIEYVGICQACGGVVRTNGPRVARAVNLIGAAAS
jgi:hypothetical protein